MKTKIILSTIVATACAVAFTGCSKSENEAPKPAAETASNAVSSAVSTMKDTASQVADKTKEVAAQATDKAKEVVAETKETAAKAVEATKDAANQAATAVTASLTAAPTNTTAVTTSQFDDIVSKAKSYIAEKKYTETLDTLNKLSGMVLSPEQQKTVDDLKAQVKNLLSSGSGAVDAAKSLLGK